MKVTHYHLHFDTRTRRYIEEEQNRCTTVERSVLDFLCVWRGLEGASVLLARIYPYVESNFNPSVLLAKNYPYVHIFTLEQLMIYLIMWEFQGEFLAKTLAKIVIIKCKLR